MNFHVFLKVFGDLCLYFACIGGFPTLFPCDFSLLWPTLVCGAAAGIGAFLSDHGKGIGRFFCLILPAACLALADTLMEVLVLLPVLAYTVILICRDGWHLEYFPFRAAFQKCLKFLGIFLLVMFFGSMLEDSVNYRDPMLDSTAVLYAGLLYAASGIILQRQLRLDTNQIREKYFNNLQLVLTALGTGLFLLGLILAERFLASQGISLSEIIGQALRAVVAFPLRILGALVMLLFGMDGKTLEKIESAQTAETTPAATGPSLPMGQAVTPQQLQTDVGFPWWLAVLILAAMTALLLYLLRQMRGRRIVASARETTEKIASKTGQKPNIRRSNRAKLRKVYREFLRTEQGRGQKLESYHTSQDILDALRPGGNPSGAEKLRQLYLKARYDEANDITPEQLSQAREALKQYREG